MTRARREPEEVEASVSAVVGAGPDALARVADALTTWRVHRWAGVQVVGPPAAVGVRVRLRLVQAPLGAVGTCVVSELDRDAHHVRLVYRTDAGHVEAGTQWFSAWLDDDGVVRGEVRSVSRPAHPLLRRLLTAGRMGQHAVALRYLQAMRRAAATPG